MFRFVLKGLFVLFAVAAATLIAAGLSSLLHGHYLFIYLAAITIATLFGGYIYGFGSLLASAIAHSYFFQHPRFHFTISSSDAIELGFFAAISVLVIFLSGRIRDLRLKSQKEVLAREDLMGMVAHDLKNPLNAVIMGTQILLDENKADHDSMTTQVCKTISSSARRMSELIDEILLFGKIQSGTYLAEVKKENISGLLIQISDIIRPLAQKKGLSYELQGENDVDVICDRSGLSHVLSNLLGNAVKYTQSGKITLSVSKSNGSVNFSVVDTGIGIPRQDLPFIFNRYWQPKRDVKKGTGLGLFIASQIVQAHGSKIKVESTEGRGARFSFSLSG